MKNKIVGIGTKAQFTRGEAIDVYKLVSQVKGCIANDNIQIREQLNLSTEKLTAILDYLASTERESEVDNTLRLVEKIFVTEIMPDAFTEMEARLGLASGTIHNALTSGGYINDNVLSQKFSSTKNLKEFYGVLIQAGITDESNQKDVMKLIQGATLIESSRYQMIRPSELGNDFRRDYDFRSENGGVDFSPKRSYYFMHAKLNLLEQKMTESNVTDFNKVVQIVRDARYYSMESIQAMIKAATERGYDVKTIVSEESSSCVSEYSWAVRVTEPSLGAFITASHVSRPSEVKVFGSKVTIVEPTTQELSSMTTEDIKGTSEKIMAELINTGTSALQSISKGTVEEVDVTESFNNMAVTAGLASMGLIEGKTLYSIDKELRIAKGEERVALVSEYAKGKDTLKSLPFAGLRVVVDGAYTKSGIRQAAPLEALGATVFKERMDIGLVKGEHEADPSRTSNIQKVIDRMKATNAHIGLSFDLDGDRGAVIVKTREGQYVIVSPDIMGELLIPFMENEGGYSQAENKAIIADCLSTEGIARMAAKYGWRVEITDAGYVYLKAKRAELVADGYEVPMLNEKSGHAWTSFTGAIECPVALNIMFASMILRAEESDLANPYMAADYVNAKQVPFLSSVRFQPIASDEALKKAADLPQNETGWKPGSPGKMPARIMGLFREIAHQSVIENMPEGTEFATKVGIIKVEKIVDQWDDKESIHRFSKIFFSLDGNPLGSFVLRASSNDPTAVDVFEVQMFPGENFDGSTYSPEEVARRYAILGGFVMRKFEELKVLNLDPNHPSAANMNEIMETVKTWDEM